MKKNKSESKNSEQAATVSEKISLFSSLKQSLRKTKEQVFSGINTLILHRQVIDEALYQELEAILLQSDLGTSLTQRVLKNVASQVSRKEGTNPAALLAVLQQELTDLLNIPEKKREIAQPNPLVILIVGVNGVGKTTTVAKLCHYFQQQDKKVLLAAGDTFRAAAIEQLQTWGERTQTPVIAQHTGADSASVLFDAFQAAKARGFEILLADTAGRLHTKHNLMDELEKIKRVLAKLDENAPHEVWLVLDGTTGQNALNQARQFHETIGLTGLIITKLDGTAKGGAVFAITQALQLPIRFIGTGEQLGDLAEFEPAQFVAALFDDNDVRQ